MKEVIRSFKNNIIQKYFKKRIYGSNNPEIILGRKTPYKFVFILSHMRSGSSLLSHILISNPAIIGFGESHNLYQSEEDLKRLMMKAYFQFQEFSKFPQDLSKLKMDHTYVLDKILHDQKIVNQDLLNLPNISVIFLLREPERTLASLLDLKPQWNQQEAYQYYTERLQKLVEYAKQINDKNRTLFVTHEQVLNQTELTLSKLQEFLQTEQPFSEEYEIKSTTGKKNIGDYKGNIKAGKIVRQKRELNHEIDQELLEKSNYIYQQYCQDLTQLCDHINLKN